jgi:hypothetical protein
MHKSLVGMMAAGALAVASPAAAQICAGNPNGALGVFVGGLVQVTEGDRYGAEAGLRIPGGLGVSAGVALLPGEGNAEDVTQYSGQLALETASLGMPLFGPKISACPMVGVSRADVEGVGELTTIPVGFGIGGSLSTIVGPSVQGYVIPQVVFTHVAEAGDDENSTDFGARLGAVLGFGTVYAGGEVGHVFRDEADPTVTIRLGLKL